MSLKDKILFSFCHFPETNQYKL